ncbi:MAG: thioredoxin domain-containing protein, partial [Ornithinimicrobium sp.]
MSNRLREATSPYLLQHADNPVHWWPWTSGAFEEARRRNVPILLSVGYAACHWCHVMAHESFEDDTVAEALNDGFVAIKVDREERPDVDAVYMQATSAMTGHAGWPMTCLLTPQAEPFWCGTFLPKEQFLQLLQSARRTWAEREDEVRAGGAHVVHTLGTAADDAESAHPLDEAVCSGAVSRLSHDYDATHGGFGGAPKFPPSMTLAFLLRHAARTGDARADDMGRGTLRAMARSGMYDQLGGGFARYAVDREWVVPHFEKMLYDNALLLRVYTDLARVSDPARPEQAADHHLARRVVTETVDWLLREMWTEEAGFAASLDADTDGVEGATYVWTREQLVQALGEQDGERAAELFSVTEEGTFEHGASTLQRRRDPDDEHWFDTVRERLDLHRTLRPQPGRDDKVVTAWNGWAIAALAEAGWYFQQPDWVDVAERCATLLLTTHGVEGRLRRSSRAGVVGDARGVAEDYAALVEGLVVLHTVTAEPRWLDQAGRLLAIATAQFTTQTAGSLTVSDSDVDVDDLVMRPRTRTDNAEPCGQSALAGALIRYGVAAGSAAHLQAGRDALSPMGSVAGQAPRFAGWALTAAEDLL